MIALDTNILIYAIDRRNPAKQRVAEKLVSQTMSEIGIVPCQVLGEFLAVIRRKSPAESSLAERIVQNLLNSCATPITIRDQLLQACALATRYQLQYFDALVLTVAAAAGATTLYSEDMHDGLTIGPLTIRNPFPSETAG